MSVTSDPPWISWRAQRLLAAGFPPALAHQLAEDGRIDLHALLELIDRGCRPDLAARILAPLDFGPGASMTHDDAAPEEKQ